MAKLTDKTLATAVTLNSLIHIVNTGDTTQSPLGSSYKAELSQLVPLFGSNPDVTVTGGTYNPSTGEITFYNNTGGTFNVSGFITGFTDSYVSGGTYSLGTATFTNTTGGTFNVSGFFTGGTDVYLTGGTYTSGNATFTNTTGGTFVVTGFTEPFSGGSGNCITDLYITNLHGCSPITIWDNLQTYSSSATGITSTALGTGTSANGDYSFSEGISTSSNGTASHSEGSYTNANGNNAHAEGSNTTASGDTSHAEGYLTNAYGQYSHAEGQSTIASGNTSHTEGYNTRAGDYAHAEGFGSKALGFGSHTEGYNTLASSNYSHAEGESTIASNERAHAEGYLTTASGDFGSHAEGNNTLASGVGSHAEGSGTTASGSYSHAEGRGTIASGAPSHAEGSNTTASGNYSHAGGVDSIASGLASFIHSSNSLVTGDRSVVLGGQNITGTTNDTVYVPYLNISNIGVGSSINNLGIDINGNVVTGTAGGVSIDPYYTEPSAISITWDVSGNSTNYQTVLTANTTLNLSNVRNGDYGTIIVQQDGVGSRTITFGTVNGAGSTHRVVNGGAGIPVLTSNPNAIDILTFTYNGSVMYWTVGNDYT